MKEKITQEREGFPQVFKSSEIKQIALVYQTHVEYYSFDSRYNTTTKREQTGEKDAVWNPYDEIEMIKGNGFRRVHGMKTVKVIDFTR